MTSSEGPNGARRPVHGLVPRHGESDDGAPEERSMLKNCVILTLFGVCLQLVQDENTDLIIFSEHGNKTDVVTMNQR